MISAVLSGLAKVGLFIAHTCEVGCVILIVLDEPECPECMIK